MRLAARLALPVALLLAPAAARAQGGPTMSCMGMLQMELGLDVQKSNGTFESIAPAAIPDVLDQAECLCNTGDLFVRAFVKTALPQGTQETYEVWAGSNCNTVTQRQLNNPAACERIVSQTTSLTDFWVGSGITPRERVPAQAMTSPNTHVCSNISSSNGLWFIFYRQADMPDNYCSITLPANTIPPPTPTGVVAGSGDSAVVLSWQKPPAGSRIAFYQILCADENDQPVAALAAKYPASTALRYSTCLPDGTIRRRVLATAGTSIATDGGVSDAGAASAPIDPGGSGAGGLEPSADPLDGGVGAQFTNGPPPFVGLDPRFLCSDLISNTVDSTRIAGLENGKVYKFVLVAIDRYGNPAPSDVQVATPQPVEDLYRRFRNQGGKAQGFCFIATAAYGSYESPFVQVLRDFRDEVLMPTVAGRALVDWYYRASPPVAGFIAEHPAARFLVRLALWPVIVAAALWLHLGAGHVALLAALGLALVGLRRARRAGRAA